MTVSIDATTNVEEVFVDETTTANGIIDFEIGQRTREYPLHIAFCIDRSGSMRQSMETDNLVSVVKDTFLDTDGTSKMEVAKSGLKKAIKELSAQDKFGVVSFESNASVDIAPTSGSDTRQAITAIDDLDPGGGTDIADGLDKSRNLLRRMPNEEAVEWIVLISDGEGTVPHDGRLDSKYSDEGIVIQAAGVGDDYDRQQMLNLAQRTQGELEDIASGKALQEFFSQEVRKAREVVARGAEMTLEPNDFVSIDDVYYRLVDQTSTIDPAWRGNTCVLDLGDVNQKNPPQIVFDMEITPNSHGANVELAEATLQTDEGSATDDIAVTVDRKLTSGLGTKDTEEESGIEPTDPDPVPEKIIMKAEQKAQNGHIDGARNYLEKNREYLTESEYAEAEQRIDDVDLSSGLGKN